MQEGGRNSVADLYSVGKTVFICIVLMVNAEVRLAETCCLLCSSQWVPVPAGSPCYSLRRSSG